MSVGHHITLVRCQGYGLARPIIRPTAQKTCIVIGLARFTARLKRLAVRGGSKPGVDPDFSANGVDLDSDGATNDPGAVYEALRKEGQVVYLPRNRLWLVLGHEETRVALSRADIFSNAPYRKFDRELLGADPPDHAPVRRLLAPCFAAPVVERLTQSVQDFVADLPRGPFDLVSGLSRPFSELLGRELLGLDMDLVEAIRRAQTLSQAAANSLDDFNARLDELSAHAGILPVLIAQGGGVLDPDRARRLVRFLWLASTNSSERLATWLVTRLLQDPDLLVELAADRARVPAFVEEVLRLHPPEHIFLRLTTQDTVLGGQQIPGGSLVQLSVMAANRDPRVFDSPETIRLDRSGSRHISFGHGIHHCIGAVLLRTAIVPLVMGLLDRADGMRAAEDLDQIPYSATRSVRVPARLMMHL